MPACVEDYHLAFVIARPAKQAVAISDAGTRDYFASLAMTFVWRNCHYRFAM